MSLDDAAPGQTAQPDPPQPAPPQPQGAPAPAANEPDISGQATSAASAPAAPAATPLTPAQKRERAACLAENTDPASPLYPVYLADYFGASPNVISFAADRFGNRFLWDRYQDALQKEQLGQPMSAFQSKLLGKPEQNTPGASNNDSSKPQGAPPFADGYTPSSPIKEIGRERETLIRSFGYSMLAKHFGVKPEDVAAAPDIYLQRYADEPAGTPSVNALPAAPDGDKVPDKWPTGMDEQQKAQAKQDPLAADGAMRNLILQNRGILSQGTLDNPESGKPDLPSSIINNRSRGKANTSVFVFDSANRPEDKGVPGTSYGGVSYTVTTEPDGRQTVHGPYRISTYANSKSSTDNTPATAEIKGKTFSEGGDDYNNEQGHKYGQTDASPGLLMGTYKYDPKGKIIFDPNVESTGPNPLHPGEHRVEWGEIHHGESDLGNHDSRGSAACFTLHPNDEPHFFSNFKRNQTNLNTGTSRGKVYTYRGDSEESLALKNWLESQHPTR